MQPESREKNDPEGNYQRLFEVETGHGSLVKELTFETPSVTDVDVCSVGEDCRRCICDRWQKRYCSLRAGADGQKPPQKLELVVGTALGDE